MKFEKEPTDQELDNLLRNITPPADLKSQLYSIPTGDMLHDGIVVPADLKSKLQSIVANGDASAQANSSADSNSIVVDQTQPAAEDPSHSISPAAKSSVATKPASSSQSSDAGWWLMLAASLLIGATVLMGYGVDWFDHSVAIVDPSDSPEPKGGIAGVNNGSIALENSDHEEMRRLEQQLADSLQSIKDLEAQVQESELQSLEDKLVELESISTNTVAGLGQREIEAMVFALADQVAIPLGGSNAEAKVKSDMARVVARYPDSNGAAIAERFLKEAENN